MARWKLVTAHYLNCVEKTEWEYKEVDRNTGRERRKVLTVPRHLDINEPSDWTSVWGNRDNQTGEIIVCHPGKGESRDIEFLGDPTPDMIPLDDEAREISASFEEHWRYKPETAEVSYSQSQIDRLEVEKAELASKPQQVEVSGLGDLVAAMAAMTQQNSILLEKLTNGKAPRL